jgi:hypothetical protein
MSAATRRAGSNRGAATIITAPDIQCVHERTRPKRLNLRGRNRAVAYHSPETLDNRTLHVLVDSGKLTQDTIGLMLARKFNWHDDEGVHWLLEHGADPNWPLWGSRPLHWALRQGTPIHYFQWLLDHGADPLLPDKNGTVPVAEAARRGRADVLELFEQRGVVIALEGDDRFLAACARANDTEARTLAARGQAAQGLEPARCRVPLPRAAIGMDAKRVHTAHRRNADHGGRQRGRRRAHADRSGMPRAWGRHCAAGEGSRNRRETEGTGSRGLQRQWAEYFVRESGAGNIEYFQREGPRPKQYAEIASYLRSREGAS